MAEKHSTLVLKTDLDCTKCYNKLRRILCQNHREIRSQAYDHKNQTVIISGPFDPNTFSKKLSLKAGKAIKSINIKADEKKVEKPKSGDEKPKPADDKPKPAAEKPKPADDKPAEKPQAKAVTFAEPVAASSKPPAAAPAAPAPAPAPILAYPVAQPYVAYPSHYHDGVYGGTPYYEGYGGNRGYDHYTNEYSEENPSCNIM